MQTRKRPWIGTTVSADMFALLQREKARDNRPLSYVLDQALRVWATVAPELEQLRHAAGELQYGVEDLKNEAGQLKHEVSELRSMVEAGAR